MLCSGSGKRRPRLARDAIAYGASMRASISSSSGLVRSIAFNTPDATTPSAALEAPVSTSVNMLLKRRSAGSYNLSGLNRSVAHSNIPGNLPYRVDLRIRHAHYSLRDVAAGSGSAAAPAAYRSSPGHADAAGCGDGLMVRPGIPRPPRRSRRNLQPGRNDGGLDRIPIGQPRDGHQSRQRPFGRGHDYRPRTVQEGPQDRSLASCSADDWDARSGHGA